MMAEPGWSAGDRALLERLVAETRAQTTPPGPSGTDYLQTLAEAMAQWMSRQLAPLGGLLHVPPALLYGLAWTILALVGALLVFTGLRLFRRRMRGSVAAHASEGEVLSAPAARTEAWAQELERRLAGADPRAALEALWWWLARALKGTEAEPSWTTRELLGRAGRSDLTAEGRVLDRLLYGVKPPAMTDVRGLAQKLRRALA